MPVLKLNKQNFLTLLLLAGIVFSIIQIGRSASPAPGHPWADLGDSPSDALMVARGGTGTTTLTVNNVLLGNTTGAVKLVAPGTTGNLLASDGTTWASSQPSSPLASLVLLNPSTSETNSTEYTTTTSETTLLSWVLNVSTGTYSYYILEADVMGNQGHSANTNVLFTWNFYEGANLKKSLQWRTIGSSITGVVGGIRQASTIKTIITNAIPASANFKINGQMSNSNAAVTMMAHSFRVYGVK